jgi:photosystem II stability/assembly factor-like uncharacterized protein
VGVASNSDAVRVAHDPLLTSPFQGEGREHSIHCDQTALVGSPRAALRKSRTLSTCWFLVSALLLWTGSASAHDASSYGGVFRSRDLGATWLNADVGLFLNAALAVAVDPRDPSRLLVGTDLGIQASRNGGRTWVPEARDLIVGAVFAVAFSPDGEQAVCAAASGVFRRDGTQWLRAAAPDAAVPARAIVAAPSGDRFYLLGRDRLFVSLDGGRTYSAVPGLPETSRMTALAAIRAPGDMLAAVIDGRGMISRDGGRTWRESLLGGAATPVDAIAADPSVPQRLWAAAAGQIFVSHDLGSAWRAAGRPLPEPGTTVRGIAAGAETTTLVVTTNRGAYRSADGGDSWVPKEDNLPTHLEAGPLARDPGDPRVIYAVYSLTPYGEVWRLAVEGGNPLARIEPLSLAGGVSFCLLVLIGAGFAARHLARRRAAAHSAR